MDKEDNESRVASGLDRYGKIIKEDASNVAITKMLTSDSLDNFKFSKRFMPPPPGTTSPGGP